MHLLTYRHSIYSRYILILHNDTCLVCDVCDVWKGSIYIMKDIYLFIYLFIYILFFIYLYILYIYVYIFIYHFYYLYIYESVVSSLSASICLVSL